MAQATGFLASIRVGCACSCLGWTLGNLGTGICRLCSAELPTCSGQVEAKPWKGEECGLTCASSPAGRLKSDFSSSCSVFLLIPERGLIV